MTRFPDVLSTQKSSRLHWELHVLSYQEAGLCTKALNGKTYKHQTEPVIIPLEPVVLLRWFTLWPKEFQSSKSPHALEAGTNQIKIHLLDEKRLCAGLFYYYSNTDFFFMSHR